MRIFRYNLEFEKFHIGILKEALILRNQDFVRKNMVYSKEITLDEHYAWFNNLNPENNFYFLIRLNKEPIGVFNIKDFEESTNMAELGIFIGKKEILSTPTPFLCCLALADLAIQLFKVLPYTKVKEGAKNIMSLNLSLGYELAETHEDYIVNYLNISKHYALTAKVRRAADILFPINKYSTGFQIQLDEYDTEDLGVKYIKQLINRLNSEEREQFMLII